ncbi:hypothetical protein W02_12350 [Nitrospira sp. KM1]|uniref:class I SAM-dependent methyltransferase n=1 Tax=Nitrospira sp. KM1 TaxID=1936990 RepID=UPI0013A79435|nr:class I SAM-dependent methyltransferase [Nitrospira sp. KM1]BCA54095.1 hypothetical protein W02_12350 [Nitrospira sp. KM1]
MPLSTHTLSVIRSFLTADQANKLRALQASRFRGFQGIVFRLLFGSNLPALAQIYNSDKWGSHWYAQHYETHFKSLRRRNLAILEIGIGGYERPDEGGGSLRMWRTYFPKSRIFGIDLYDKSFHDERRIRTFRGSQIDPEFLHRVLNEIGPIDIIIDDGSHMNEHVLYTFNVLFPHLNPTGIYVIEDLQTAYWQSFGGSSDLLNNSKTSISFLKQLVDGLNYAEFEIPSYEPTYLNTHIAAVHFYHNIVFIQKGINDEKGGGPDLGRQMNFNESNRIALPI